MIRIAALAALALAATPALAQAPVNPGKPVEASIPFVNHGGIRDWRAQGDSTLYVQDQSGQWYRASLMGPAFDLPFAQAIGFDARGTDTFDRFASVVVRGQSYPVQSLVKVAGPPMKTKTAQAKPAA
ncbi:MULTISPECIES: DUF6491 family protein [unclassified Novosphingobium]|uniref:DUF6491 family protein n=1 Tax=unclassified Novosphingobium TaxID=2644732 RepID=UPI001494AD3C|nr:MULTISPECIES: DUF6491 family protein [unclassified Novosphingobium]MBB3357366.1 hypothetical protein [Novosphingobium sp. BK256]MBB3373972.1 hypothetical protein [Novosphingobium sp. BK280]MBB3378384.1 hypothetical protein [Novosphingobium sp. BK258]MBB3419832.1 hypothetical protein [Novosphingobium sp. BK267]MBB3447847.1 hypothetical protein [Novosphingobium sp. BK352]